MRNGGSSDAGMIGEGSGAEVRCRHPACLDDESLLARCEATTGRTGGPGGQNRNKVDSAVRLRDVPTGLIAQASERRSQHENRRVALRRLRLLLAVKVRCEAPVPMKPRGKTVEEFLVALDGTSGRLGMPAAGCSTLWRSRLVRRAGAPGKIACNPEHHDYPALLAEAMDMIAGEGWDPKAAADRLGVTVSQLIKLVKDHPPAVVELNLRRGERGLHAVK